MLCTRDKNIARLILVECLLLGLSKYSTNSSHNFSLLLLGTCRPMLSGCVLCAHTFFLCACVQASIAAAPRSQTLLYRQLASAWIVSSSLSSSLSSSCIFPLWQILVSTYSTCCVPHLSPLTRSFLSCNDSIVSSFNYLPTSPLQLHLQLLVE